MNGDEKRCEQGCDTVHGRAQVARREALELAFRQATADQGRALSVHT